MTPVRLVFVTFGVFLGAWAVAAADVQHELALSPAGLGLLLSGSVAAGGLAAGLCGPVAARWGVHVFLQRALVLWGAGALVTVAAHGRIAFVAVFVATMIGAGLVDMAMNASVAVFVGGDATAMVRFHALYNAGALAGAVLTGAVVDAGLSWRWSWVAAGAGALCLSYRLARSVRPTAGSGRQPESSERESGVSGGFGPLHSWVVVRAAGLAGLAVTFVACASVESGIDTWGVLYLRRHLAAGVLLGAGAYALSQVIAVTVRTAGSAAAGRAGPRRGLALGAAAAAAGMALEALVRGSAGAAVGLVIGAAGIALCWPLAMSMAARRAQELGRSPAPLVAALTASGYVGWVVGPAIVGLVADATTLRGGLFLLAGVAAAAAGTVTATAAPGRAQ